MLSVTKQTGIVAEPSREWSVTDSDEWWSADDNKSTSEWPKSTFRQQITDVAHRQQFRHSEVMQIRQSNGVTMTHLCVVLLPAESESVQSFVVVLLFLSLITDESSRWWWCPAAALSTRSLLTHTHTQQWHKSQQCPAWKIIQFAT